MPVIVDSVDEVARANVSVGVYEPVTVLALPLKISEPVAPPGLVIVRVGNDTLVATIPAHWTSTKKPGLMKVMVPVGKYDAHLFAELPWITPLPVSFPEVGTGVPPEQPKTFAVMVTCSNVATPAVFKAGLK
jgi:hypothetical protein